MSEEITKVYAFRQASPDVATSGQPTEVQLAAIAVAGYDTVVNLGLHDDKRYALPDEASTVRSLGMEYVHIPVRFDNPTRDDLIAFTSAMQSRRKKSMGPLRSKHARHGVSRPLPRSPPGLGGGASLRFDERRVEVQSSMGGIYPGLLEGPQ